MARDAVSKRTTRQSTRRQQNLSDQQNQPPPPPSQHQKQQQQQEPPQSGLDNKCDQRELVNNETKPIEPVLIDVPISDEKKKEIVYKDVQEMLENDLNCAICRETYINPLILNCSHSFCKFCVYHWLNRKPGCPTCRMTVTFQAENLALRNIINRMIQKSSQENQTIRANAVSQRLKDEEQQLKDGVIPKILKPYAPDGHRLVRRGGHYSLRAVGPTDESTPAQGGNANVVISGFPRLDFSEFSPRLGRPARYHPLPSVLQDLSYGDGDDDDDDDDDDMDDDVEIFVNRGDINNLSDYFESDDSEDEDDDYIANDDDDDDGDNDEEDDEEDEDDDDADESDEDDDIHDNERHEDTVDIMSFSDSESDESYVPDLSFREHDSLDTYYVESDEDSVPMNRFSSSSSSSSIASIPTGYHVSDSSSEDDDSVNIVPGRQTDGSAMDTEDEEEGRSRHDSWMRDDDDDDDDDDEDDDEDDEDDDDDSFPSLDRSDSDFDSASSPDENSDLDMDSDSDSDSDSDR